MRKTAMLAVALAALCVAGTEAHAESIQMPIQQLQSGVPTSEVECAGKRVLMLSSTGSPACVFADSVGILEARGFVLQAQSTSNDDGAAVIDTLNEIIENSNSDISRTSQGTAAGSLFDPRSNNTPYDWPRATITFPEQVRIGEQFQVVMNYTYILPNKNTGSYDDPELQCRDQCLQNTLGVDMFDYVDYVGYDGNITTYLSSFVKLGYQPTIMMKGYEVDPPYNNTAPQQLNFNFVINEPDIDYQYGYIDLVWYNYDGSGRIYYNVTDSGVVHLSADVMESIGDGSGQISPVEPRAIRQPESRSAYAEDLPETHARAMRATVPSIDAAGSITDTDDLILKGALDIDTFGSGGRTYAAVISQGDEGIQILDVTDPYEIVAAGSITHTYRLMLAFAQDMDVFGSGGRTYAAVASYHNGVQILDVTDPHNIVEADTIIDVGDLVLGGPTNIDTFKLKDRTYAAVTSSHERGIQILDVTDPYEITPAGSITGADHIWRPLAEDIDAYELDGRTYAAVTTYSSLWTLDVTDPHRIAATVNTTFADFRYLYSDDTDVFTVDGRAYAAGVSYHGNSVQIFDITDPDDIVAADGIGNLSTVTLGGASAIDTFESGGNTYAAVASYDDGGVQILRLTAQADIPPTPRQQVLDGVSSDRIACIGDRILMQSPSGAPACVFAKSADLLLVRGFAPFAFEEPDPIPPEVASANNAFAMDFYKEIAKTDGNHFFSPPGMQAAFSVLYEGAGGETAGQIRAAFGLIPDDAARHQSVRDTMSSLNRHDPHATLEVANSLWLADLFAPRSEYVDIVRSAYRADIETVDFADKGTADLINDWADKKTRGKVPEVLSPDDINESSMAAVLNAIYFKGAWENPFPTKDTRGADFWTGNGIVDADFMNIMAEFEHAAADGVQVLRMPYVGDRLSMLVVLPNERGGLATLEGNITHASVDEWRNLVVPNEDVAVSIPKFEAKTRYDLVQLLPHLGITDVFDESLSDLSGMGDGPLFISKATQDAYVNVNEEGTEAAAVTSLVMTMSSPPSFVADHPFLFFIIDDESGAILFMGRITDPTV